MHRNILFGCLFFPFSLPKTLFPSSPLQFLTEQIFDGVQAHFSFTTIKYNERNSYCVAQRAPDSPYSKYGRETCWLRPPQCQPSTGSPTESAGSPCFISFLQILTGRLHSAEPRLSIHRNASRQDSGVHKYLEYFHSTN